MAKNVLSSIVMALLLSSLAIGDVIVVDINGGPGADYGQVSEALANAKDGDTILVRRGTYRGGPLVARATSVAVVAEEPVHTKLEQVFEVYDLASSQTVILQGFPGLKGALIRDCKGAVWLEDCDLGDGLTAVDELGTVVVSESDRVMLNRCSVQGRYGISFWGVTVLPKAGVHAKNSSLAIYESAVRGGDGCAVHCDDYQRGAAGAVVDSGFLWTAASEFRGGQSGVPLEGGEGLWLRFYSPRVRALQTVFVGGYPGGEDVKVSSGSFNELTGTARYGWVQSPRRVGASMLLSFRGVPGDFVMIHHNVRASLHYLEHLRGVLLVDPIGLVSNAVGIIPAGGQLDVSVSTPSIAGLEEIGFFTQATFFNGSGEVVLGSPSFGVVVDPSF